MEIISLAIGIGFYAIVRFLAYRQQGQPQTTDAYAGMNEIEIALKIFAENYS